MKTFETEKGNSDWWKELSEYALNIDGSSALSYQFDGTRLRIHKGMNHDQWLEFAKLILNGKCKIQSKQLDAIEKVEWNGEGLPPVGVECEMIFDGKGKLITPLYFTDFVDGLVLFYHSSNSKTHCDDTYGWCLVGNCIFRKPESPEAKKEREELELGKSLMETMKDAFPNSVNHCSDDLAKWARVAKDIGYRKGE